MSIKFSKIAPNGELKNIALVGNKDLNAQVAQFLVLQSRKLGYTECTYIAASADNAAWRKTADRYFVVKKQSNLDGLMSALINEVTIHQNRVIVIDDYADFKDKRSIYALAKNCRNRGISAIVLADEADDALVEYFTEKIEVGV